MVRLTTTRCAKYPNLRVVSFMSVAKANRHADLSRRLMAQANYELNTMGDRVQASDKASGAVAHAVKAIGEDRNWRNGSHNLRRDIIGLLANEYGQPELLHLQAMADQLHDNYFEDQLGDSLVGQLLAETTRMIVLVWDIREAGPNAGYLPQPDQQRIINRLLIPEDVAQADDSIDLAAAHASVHPACRIDPQPLSTCAPYVPQSETPSFPRRREPRT